MAKSAFQTAGRNDGRLYFAVVNGDYRTVAKELAKGDIDPDLSIHGKTMLHHAGERGFKEIARFLIDHGANVDVQYGKQRRSLLHFAAATYNYGFACVLLERGANPNSRTTNGSTPLHFAARTNQQYLVRKLVEAKADVLAEDAVGRTPFHLAMTKGYVKLAKELLDATTDRDRRFELTAQLKVAEIDAAIPK